MTNGLGNAFVEMLGMARRGTLLEDLANELAVLTAAVQETGQGGSLTLTLKIEPMKNDRSTVFLSDKIATKLPKNEADPSIAYIHEGRITRRDPRQPELPMSVGPRVVDANVVEGVS